MKNLFYVTLLILSSCAIPKNMIYFSDVEKFSAQTVSQNYDNRIQKDDLLSIVVSSKNPELVVPFNPITLATSPNVTSTSLEYTGYLVNSKGEIVFPFLGKLNIVGLTYSELASFIEQKIIDGGYVNDPTVTVKLLNYKISVLGEVKLPGVKNINSERVTILDALGLAGDLTIYGQRHNISVIREEDGKREVAVVDISNKELFNSPYYYLRPNDIVYVQPNKKQQRTSVYDPYVLPSILSGTSIIVTILGILLR